MRSTSSITGCSNCTQQLLRSILYSTIDESSIARSRISRAPWRSRTIQPLNFQREVRTAQNQNRKAARPDIMLQIQKETSGKQTAPDTLDMIGVLPDTLVMPEKISEWFNRELLVTWLKVRGGEAYTYFTTRSTYKKADRKSLITKKGVAQIAQDLHQRMSEAFAKGEIWTVGINLCQGFKDTLNRRISNRPRTQVLRWTAVERFGAPKLVSFKAFVLPPAPGTTQSESKPALLQAIVRLKMKQRLEKLEVKMVREGSRVVEKEVPVENGVIEKDVTEHVVLQKAVSLREEGSWKIFGLYQPVPFVQWQEANKAHKEKMMNAQDEYKRRTAQV